MHGMFYDDVLSFCSYSSEEATKQFGILVSCCHLNSSFILCAYPGHTLGMLLNSIYVHKPEISESVNKHKVLPGVSSH